MLPLWENIPVAEQVLKERHVLYQSPCQDRFTDIVPSDHEGTDEFKFRAVLWQQADP